MLETFAAFARSLEAFSGSGRLYWSGWMDRAGKSTFTQVLADAFAALGGRAAIVHLDDFYRPTVERPSGR